MTNNLLKDIAKKEKGGGQYQYEASLIIAGLTYLEGHSSTKAGDGARCLDFERIALLYFMGSKKSKNYKIATAKDLIETLCTFTEFQSHLSINNRFVNLSGKPNSCKSVDHMVEHLVLVLKRCHTGGQSKRSLEVLSLSLDLFLEMSANMDRQFGVGQKGGNHTRKLSADVINLAELIFTESKKKENENQFVPLVRFG